MTGETPRGSGGIEGSAALEELLWQLRERHRGAVNAVLAYGSCLRNGNIFDGLLDLYLVCDDYRSAYARSGIAAANWLLPPNVFYTEIRHGERVLRTKYAVISGADFRRGCSTRWFESYIWGRFAQPTQLVYCRDRASGEAIEQCLVLARRTFLQRALPRLPATGTVAELWQGALALSYGTELRSEGSGRPGELVGASAAYFEEVARAAGGNLSFPFQVFEADHALHYRAEISRRTRRMSGLGWAVRRVQGKLMSFLRLFKALFTFDGGIDYVAWKLERHSGQVVEVPDRVRRYPLLFMWGFFWRLYRRGVFR